MLPTMDARLVLFGLGTLTLACVSRASLLKPRSHGFSRFFAWEVMLALTLLNAPGWFRAPFALHQLISWVLLCASLVPLVLGVTTLRRLGKPDSTIRDAPQLMAFERTTQLVSDGIYRYIRHPLYSSLLVLTWGIFFKVPSVPGGTLAIAATSLLMLTAKRDEVECLEVFGKGYREYMGRTHMFIPYVF
jgi:protein-S-isoprenylcysteine O-methyltransferase Ste14